jgi:cytochrome o ubiquinol oxidase subunit II
MANQTKPVWFILLFSGFVLLIILIMQPLEILKFRPDIDILFPKGIIALKQRNLLFILQGLMLLVVIPVYILTFVFSWKYRAHKTAKYDPDLEDSKLAEFIWWGFPCVLVIFTAILTWIATHRLDPYKPIPSEKKPITIQAVALQWKWLFIYPEEKIATVNFVQFPEQTPVKFEITADAPMNSLWIPQLGGQIYAMPGMHTKLHLMADQAGDFKGSSANLSGEGFSGMHFIARASTTEEFEIWVQEAQNSKKRLTWTEYEDLALRSFNNPVTIYQLEEEKLFEEIIMKFMHPHPMKE